MNQLIITSGVHRAPVVKTYIRKRLNKTLGTKGINSCFCRVKNQFSIYAVELVIETDEGEVIEAMGRHFYVNKAFDIALYFLAKKMDDLNGLEEIGTSELIPRTA